MRVRALKYYYLDRKEYQAGDEFEMDDRMAGEISILCTIGTLQIMDGQVPKPAPPPPPPPPPLSAEAPVIPLQAEPMQTYIAPTEEEPRRKYYRRKDSGDTR